ATAALPASARRIAVSEGTAPPAAPPLPLDGRRKVVAAVSLVLALWGFFLFLVGLVLGSRPAPPRPSPLGNGTPPFFLYSGCVTAAVGLALWAGISGRAVLGSRVGLKIVQLLAFLAAMATLTVG